MTTFAIKLVDHRQSTADEMSHVTSSLQKWFGAAFDGTKDGVTVSWGAGATSDDLVFHFVEDVANSFIRSKWKTASINANAGGHTHSTGNKKGESCSELYRTTPARTTPLRRFGGLAFHEALHNLFPFRDDVHTAMGGGLASAVVPDELPNDDNKQWLRRGLAVKITQIY